jgi:hypothetical protein
VTKCFRTEPLPQPLALVAARADVQKRITEVATTSGQIQINNREQEIPLTRSNAPAANESLIAMAAPSAVRSGKATLKLEGLELKQEPGAAIRIFLLNKTDVRRAFVSTLNFFGWSVGHQAHAPAGAAGRNLSFDITPQLRDLHASAGSDNLTVVFAATTGLSGRATELSQAAYQRAEIRVRRISIEVEDQARVLDLR